MANPSTLLLARTPPVPSTSTYSTHIPSARSNDHPFHPAPATPPTSHSALPPNSPSHLPYGSTHLFHPAALPNLHPTFSPANPGPCVGTVEIVVDATTFLVHKEVILHASPFFESVLTGEWAETAGVSTEDDQGACSLAPSQAPDFASALQNSRSPGHSLPVHIPPSHDCSPVVDPDPAVPGSPPSVPCPASPASIAPPAPAPQTRPRRRVDARIYLKEERAAPFQDLLMFVYPHLECVCTWHNASDLMTMAQKFDMPLLQRHVLNFLLSAVAGKPIEAMRIAEEHRLTELYRESSRFLLDNWQGWDAREMESLSAQTLLKLEKRRTWFLERLLKLGLVNSSRDYVCPPTCADPQHCARLVDDKWRSAFAASFKFGPPQPSSVYRALRCLEPSLHSPALLLPHTSCQQHAIRFFADLFDRMFSQFTPRGPGSGGVGIGAGPAGEQVPGSLGFGGPALATVGVANISSDKAVRKAKYFLSVELGEAGDKGAGGGRKRGDV